MEITYTLVGDYYLPDLIIVKPARSAAYQSLWAYAEGVPKRTLSHRV
jgi:hypothetical protein